MWWLLENNVNADDLCRGDFLILIFENPIGAIGWSKDLLRDQRRLLSILMLDEAHAVRVADSPEQSFPFAHANVLSVSY